jgi:hypothetical protein
MRAGGAAVALVAAMALTGCTVIRITEGDETKVHYYPGVAVVKVERTDQMQVVSVRGLGVSVAGDMANLGLLSADIALVPPGDCAMVLWKPTKDAVQAVNGLLAGAKACPVKGENEP